jgi:hypothetical protein
MSYKIFPIHDEPETYWLEDVFGNKFAKVSGLENAMKFAAVDEMIYAMQDLMDEQNGPPLLRRNRQWQDAYDACDKILTRFNRIL